MLFGYKNNARELTPISANRNFVLIVGSRETLIRAALESIHAREPMILIDLDGESVEEIMGHISHPARKGVYLFELDWHRPPPFNVLTDCSPERRPAVVNR